MARIAGINIPQNKVVSIALTYIHGIGLHSSKIICKKLDIPSSKRVNELTEEQVLGWVWQTVDKTAIEQRLEQDIQTTYFDDTIDGTIPWVESQE